MRPNYQPPHPRLSSPCLAASPTRQLSHRAIRHPRHPTHHLSPSVTNISLTRPPLTPRTFPSVLRPLVQTHVKSSHKLATPSTYSSSSALPSSPQESHAPPTAAKELNNAASSAP
ncbi:hypothetical protein E2C01_046559 [Portunus trituberculatus]|uniref:Uncharacterized protein n=1 Tax=Portunus trituberculatus TaxID=210409 RepID=A0A5B7G1B2_PORTR|nr:hypothetical protein [Portunus trituberculatus]